MTKYREMLHMVTTQWQVTDKRTGDTCWPLIHPKFGGQMFKMTVGETPFPPQSSLTICLSVSEPVHAPLLVGTSSSCTSPSFAHPGCNQQRVPCNCSGEAAHAHSVLVEEEQMKTCYTKAGITKITSSFRISGKPDGNPLTRGAILRR